MRLSRAAIAICLFSDLFGLIGSVVALRIELSATRLSAGFGQPALDYRSRFISVGMAGIEPTRSCSQGTWACRYPTSRCFVFSFSDPCGIRTQPLQLERLTTSPEVERAVVFCQRARLSAVGREALESSSPGFQPSAIPSQLPTRHRTGTCGRTHIIKPTKKARCRCDTGLLKPVSCIYSRASQAQWMRGYIPCEKCFSLGGISRTVAFLDRTWP